MTSAVAIITGLFICVALILTAAVIGYDAATRNWDRS